MATSAGSVSGEARATTVGEAFFAFRDHSIAVELTRGEFDAVLDRCAPLPDFASERVRMVHATIGVGLIVRSITCFLLPLAASGYVEGEFDLPLDELARKAGEGPNLGMGPIRLVCRGQCSIPWHARSMWQPQLAGSQSECMQVQRAVWRNRLGLKLSAAIAATPAAGAASLPRLNETQEFESRAYRDVVERGRQKTAEVASRQRPKPDAPAKAASTPDATLQSPAAQAYTAALLRQYNERVARLQARHSAELEAQRVRLEASINAQRREVQTLRLRLLREQERNRRLQALLREQDDDA